MKRSIADQLRQMKELVQSTHWIKYSYRREEGDPLNGFKKCYCLVGLINVTSDLPAATHGGHELYSARGSRKNTRAAKVARLIRSAINEGRRSPIGSLESWNDAKSRRREDVIAVLDRAIEKAEVSS